VNDHRLAAFLARAERFMDRVESALRLDIEQPDWDQAIAFRYRKRVSGQGYIVPVRQVGAMRLEDLQEIDVQKEKIRRNTAQFVAGLTANNVLLTGARGTGKSSLVRACLNTYCNQGLRLIEVDKEHLVDLPDIVEIVATRSEKFLIFCDDLSFDQGEAGYKALKSVLDGSVSETSANVLIYATSNRRHLLPEYMAENLSYTHTDSGEVHPGEGVEEKISLSERFGLWVSFYPFTQDEYLHIAAQWLSALGVSPERVLQARPQALIWALERGSRTGRVAWQFAKDYAGRQPSVPGTGAASAGP
jgi:predicted AAA+ superfamily ATPase